MSCHEKHLNLKSFPRQPHCDGSSLRIGENFMTNRGKLHVGSLRIPDDPSWPKIPQRRFPDSFGDIDQSGVVTVTATPRRSRSIIRTPSSVPTKGIASKENVESTIYNSGFIYHSQSMPPPLRRRPGSVDPRFKKVTTVKSQIKTIKNDENRETPMETTSLANVLSNQVNVGKSVKNAHSIPEKDINVQKINQQETEKKDKEQVKEAKSQELKKSDPDNCQSQQNEKCYSSNVNRSPVCETIAKANCESREADSKKSQETRKTGNETELQKIMDLLPNDKFLKSSNAKEMEKERKEEKNESLCFYREKSNSEMKKPDKYLLKESNGSESLSDEELYRTRCKEHNMDDKESFFPATTDSEFVNDNETVTTLNRKKKFRNYNSPIDESNYSAKNYELINYFQTHGDFDKYRQSIDFSDLDEKRGKFVDKNKIKSEQNLSHGIWKNVRNSEPLIPVNQRRCATSYSKRKSEKDEVTDSEFAFLWPEQQHRTRRKSSHGYSQKLIDERRNRSCDFKKQISPRLQKNHPDAYENCAEFVARFNESKKYCSKVYQENAQQGKSIDLNIQDANTPRTETDIASEKPKRIPYKTQKLLNKSYWEYYRKLNKNNVAENTQKQGLNPDEINKKRGNVTIYEEQSELSPPEIRTLKRCSVLSSMINKKLDSDSQPTLYSKRPSLNNVKLSEDNERTDEFFAKQVDSVMPTRTNDGTSVSSRPESKRNNSQVDIKLIKLKTIAFFGILMYLIIIFLPMLYDHIFHEDYDEYADLTYLELAVDYVISSYREAFKGIVEFVNRVLYRPPNKFGIPEYPGIEKLAPYPGKPKEYEFNGCCIGCEIAYPIGYPE